CRQAGWLERAHFVRNASRGRPAPVRRWRGDGGLHRRGEAEAGADPGLDSRPAAARGGRMSEQPLWQPDLQRAARSNLTRFWREAERRASRAFGDYDALHRWSVEASAEF